MKNVKLVRNILFILGVTFFFSIVAFSLYHTHYMWTNEFKADSFNSFTEYYFTRAKGEIITACLAGIIPIFVGLFLNNKYITK